MQETEGIAVVLKDTACLQPPRLPGSFDRLSEGIETVLDAPLQPPPYLSLVSGPDWHQNPYPAFAALRRKWPVARLDWPKRGAGDWLITRYADVKHALACLTLSVNLDQADCQSDRFPPRAVQSAEREPLRGTILLLDAPQHTAPQKTLAASLNLRFSRVQPDLQRGVAAILEDATRRGSLDLMAQFAEPVTALMMSELMGFPLEEMGPLKQWSAAYARRGFIFGPEFVRPNVLTAVACLKEYVRSRVAARRARPKDDLLGAMVMHSNDEHAQERIVNTSLLLITAGLQSAKHALGNALAALIEAPGAFAMLAANPDLLLRAIEECFRYDGPSVAVGRVATADMIMAGVTVPKGAFLRLALASANHDADQFEDPDRLNLQRHPNRHLAFGSGSHVCLGARISRLTTRLALGELVKVFRGFSLVPGGAVREHQSALRGFAELHATCQRI